MLPELGKKRSTDAPLQGRISQPRILNNDSDIKQSYNNAKSFSAKKVRTGGGFMKSSIPEQISPKQSLPAQKFIQPDQFAKFTKIRKVEDLSAQIKLIEKKIKVCQKKLQQDKKRERILAEQRARDRQKPDYNFQKVVQRQLQMQANLYQNEQNHNFDYLTNPKINGEQEQEIQPEPIIQKKLIIQKPVYSIEAGVQKLQKFYQNSLKKKFERRQMFPHQACRRKTPKLYITQKTNALSKYGKAQNQAEHLFRVLTKQTTPQQIYPTIPNFAVVKDNLSKNIVAYLGDYKPFIDKTKEAAIGNSIRLNQKTQQNKTNQNSQVQGRDLLKNNQQGLRINIVSKTKTNQRQQLQA